MAAISGSFMMTPCWRDKNEGKGKPGSRPTAGLEFILGRARINLKPSPVIFVSARNNFPLEMAEIGKKPLKKQGDALLEPHRSTPVCGKCLPHARNQLICWR
ncbi:hypothetical protein Hrubri_0583 [Herbaspirillum rubrisubalbicans M1]|nr:hypothetical protein Hrubri_0583 [Herbaspirillum rubrisubalbicans M1]